MIQAGIRFESESQIGLFIFEHYYDRIMTLFVIANCIIFNILVLSTFNLITQ